MDIITAYCTDAGAIKRINQDSLCILHAVFGSENVVLSAVCDGLGGLSDGETASSFVISRLSEWFENSVCKHLKNGSSMLAVRKDLDLMLHETSEIINLYSDKTGRLSGTTMTCMLYIEHFGKFLCAHIGDTRLYKITDEKTEILTTDHSVLSDEIRKGIISAEEASSDERQNQLTKCMGAGLKNISFDYRIDSAETGAVYMICSDGFRKKLKNDEISSLYYSASAEARLRELTDLCIRRNETDNISAVLVKLNEKAES